MEHGFFPGSDFLLWYFTFIDTDFITCPHCSKEIQKDDLESFAGSESITCLYCNKKINKDDIKT
jgi:uncharacterized Zn-finger protein